MVSDCDDKVEVSVPVTIGVASKVIVTTLLGIEQVTPLIVLCANLL